MKNLLAILSVVVTVSQCLTPYDSTTREVKELNGMWTFVAEPANSDGIGLKNSWWKNDLTYYENSTQMPVPSSFNDITQSKKLRDHVGWVWYQRHFYIPRDWATSNVSVRFESVQYYAIVYLNDNELCSHVSGKLPFECHPDLSTLDLQQPQRLTVAINNTLSPDTLPSGAMQYKSQKDGYPPGFYEMTYDFDFFPYAGIERPVKLLRKPVNHITDLNLVTDITGQNGILKYDVSVFMIPQRNNDLRIFLTLRDANGKVVHRKENRSNGEIHIENVNLWWPRGMNESVAYLYTLEVLINCNNDVDQYFIPVGFRTVSPKGLNVLINNEVFYLKGFGMHEDADIRGKGFDLPTIAKDYSLLDWVGANGYRTSHYPYAEEFLMEADRRGFVVIDELPVVSVKYFNNVTLTLHRQLLRELVARDRNHPSVIMWSLSNEAKTSRPETTAYYTSLVELARQLDPTRLITAVLNTYPTSDQVAQLLDVIHYNRYFGWYQDIGYTEQIEGQVKNYVSEWVLKFKKPVINSEYGAGSLTPYNTDPSVAYSEQYQLDVLAEHHRAFDYLRKNGLLAGEMLWNLFDFMTVSNTIRPYGCVKGIFTRNRQPKRAAYQMRDRYSGF